MKTPETKEQQPGNLRSNANRQGGRTVRFPLSAGAIFAACLMTATLPRGAQAPLVARRFTAHEWGTFTSIAGKDGQGVDWLPLTGSTDLPGFVEHFRNASFKGGLRGTVRLETPVLYFYSKQETTVSVKVTFSKGLLTEWYPHASRVQPAGPLTDVSLYQKGADGSIAWDAVTLEPSGAVDLPREGRLNHYYAARDTSASPLRVTTPQGDQREKFLFYRGVSMFPVPISVKITPGGAFGTKNLTREEIPATILFERRGEKLGYRIAGALGNEAILDPPDLTATMDSLRRDVEEMLVVQGLYADEARAMFETWQDSWFEEGSRLFYIVPRQFVDATLPLSIHPAPEQTVRVFVGRLELVTSATQREVARAMASDDRVTLGWYGRFLVPILETMVGKEENFVQAAQFREYLRSFYGRQIAQNTSKQNRGQLDRNRNAP
jgi:hypothetical protein